MRRAKVPPTLSGRRRVARRVHRELAKRYPDAHCELSFQSPFQLVVATVLSAQTTDARVNAVTPALFAAYPDPAALSAAEPGRLERIIAPTGFYRAKAASLIGLASKLVDDFDDVVPATLDELTTLPGVGRKTANVVLGNAFGVPGLTVDTHVGRLSRRLGWTEHTDPEKVESDLAVLFDKRDWTMLSHRLIFHGRRTCHSRRPACGICPVARWCPAYGMGPTDPEQAAALVRDRGAS